MCYARDMPTSHLCRQGQRKKNILGGGGGIPPRFTLACTHLDSRGLTDLLLGLGIVQITELHLEFHGFARTQTDSLRLTSTPLPVPRLTWVQSLTLVNQL
jgi:hypothetical protein